MQHLSSFLLVASLVFGTTACSFSKDTYVNPRERESDTDLDGSVGELSEATEGQTSDGPAEDTDVQVPSPPVDDTDESDTDGPSPGPAEDTDDRTSPAPMDHTEEAGGGSSEPDGSARGPEEAGTNDPSDTEPTEETEDTEPTEETEDPPPTCSCQGNLQCVDVEGNLQCVNACAQNNGGCDPLAECQNTNTLDGPACGACPIGYAGDGTTGCVPALLELGLSRGTLEPELDLGLDTYDVRIPVFLSSISLTPVVPNGASVTVAGQAISSGAAWTSPDLEFDEVLSVPLVVTQPGQPSMQYTVRLSRGTYTTATINASNAEVDDYFGYTAALSEDGTMLVVGAYGEDSDGSSLTNNNILNAGTVYVYTRNSAGVWSYRTHIKAPTPTEHGNFGMVVALSGDGRTLAITAPGEENRLGAAYIFTSSSADSWTQRARLKASNGTTSDGFGAAMSLSGDGQTLAVGARSAAVPDGDTGAGAVYVFKPDAGGNWTLQASLQANDATQGDQFGNSVALSHNGVRLAVGAQCEDGNHPESYYDEGAVYMFYWNNFSSAWEQRKVKPTSPGQQELLGRTIALSGDGNTLAASGQYGNVYAFNRIGSNDWTQAGTISVTSLARANLTLTRDGNTLGVGISQISNLPGSAQVYVRTSSGWLTSSVWSHTLDETDVTGLILSSNGNVLSVARLNAAKQETVYVYR